MTEPSGHARDWSEKMWASPTGAGYWSWGHGPDGNGTGMAVRERKPCQSSQGGAEATGLESSHEWNPGILNLAGYVVVMLGLLALFLSKTRRLIGLKS